MQAAAAIPILEGIVGNVLKQQANDTGASNVGQEAARWLECMKKELRDLPESADVEITGLDSSGWTADDFTDITGSGAGDAVLGVAIRSLSSGPTNFCISQEAAANVACGDDDVLFRCMVPGRVSTTVPSYRFIHIPGGLYANASGNGFPTAAGISVSLLGQADASTTATAGTIITVWRDL